MHPRMAAFGVSAALASFVSFVGWATAGTFAPVTDPQIERLFGSAPEPSQAVEAGDAAAVSYSDRPVESLRASAQPDSAPPTLTSLRPEPAAPSGPDPLSDKVGATAGEFRVDESGAATYSIPLYAVPGTAGVAPKLSLNYSSQGGDGPLGKGWSIGGLSAISRCRGTREAGDFISDGVPVDGNPAPVNFGSTDKICLDGQRLIKVSDSPACPAVSGMTVAQWRTEIESFQRVCGYTPSGGANGVVFFTIQRRDGSISWYGDRAASDSAAGNQRPGGYVNATTPGQTAKAMIWAQNRFQDSAGNYIDFIYWEHVANDQYQGEHLLTEVRYTGKVGTGAASPYAEITFNYQTVPLARGYQSGGLVTRSRRLMSITSSVDHDHNGSYTQVRHYRLDYDPSVSGSDVDTLIAVTECRSNAADAVCLEPTVFNWSQATNEFAVKEHPGNLSLGSIEKFEGFKLGDIDGDGRKDLVWLKDGGGGDSCGTEYILVAFGQLDGEGRQTFVPASQAPTCTPAELRTGDNYDHGEDSWQLFDYNGDGRDDLFVFTFNGWAIYPSIGRPNGNRPFNLSQNLIAGLSPAIPSGNGTDHRPLLADFNGDGLLDTMYWRSGYRVRLMQRDGATFGWGAERTLGLGAAGLPGTVPCGPNNSFTCYFGGMSLHRNSEAFQLYDFNGDGGSDLLAVAYYDYEYTPPDCIPESPEPAPSGLDIQPKGCTIRYFRQFTHAMRVESISATGVQMQPYDELGGPQISPKFADINGDGLTDAVMPGSNGWSYRINTGAGFQAAVQLPSLNSFTQYLRVVDANGDGRADLLYPGDTGSSKHYIARYAKRSGGFEDEQVNLPNAAVCEGSGCNINEKVPIFDDFDADGALDFVSLKLSDSNNGDMLWSRAGAASRYKPRDVITSVVNGFGAVTQISYQPLTNNGVYARESGSRALSYGRDSPVQDLLAPIYVVSKVASSSPQRNAPNARAWVHYAYYGARVQAGGRGFLGFRVIRSYDINAGDDAYVVAQTQYGQAFPFIGMPVITTKWTVGVAHNELACHAGTIRNNCFSAVGEDPPPQPGTGRIDAWFSRNTQIWEDGWGPDLANGFDPGVQRPVHLHTAGTTEVLRDPDRLEETSTVETTFEYSSYGDAVATDVLTRKGDGTWLARVSTANTYGDNSGSKWWLGRLTDSTVTHRRPDRDNVVRKTRFDYHAVTGQLIKEQTAPGEGNEVDLTKYYDLDAYGNRTAVYICNSELTEADCKDRNKVVFRPAGATGPTTRVQRYTRTVYDPRGRFPTHTYEPFWDGTTAAGDGDSAAEHLTLQVISRNEFGDIKHARGLNNADATALAGTLGRPYYTWAETVQNAGPGEAAKGAESWTTYRWCAPAAGGWSCPDAARFVQIAQGEGSPAKFTYFDVLARPMLTATLTFNSEIEGKQVSAVCSFYDAAGKPEHVSNPFFIAELTNGPIFAGNECAAGPRQWTTTDYDVIGRPIQVTSPGSEGSTTVTMSYNGLATTLTDQRGKRKLELRNALGELIGVTDAFGATTGYGYDAAGNVVRALRHADRGNIVTTMIYDAYGRKLAQSDPDAGDRSYSYNALGELLTQTDIDWHRNESYYDGRGRVWLRRDRRGDNGTIESEHSFDFDTAANGLGALGAEGTTHPNGGAGGGYGTGRVYQYDTLGRPGVKIIGIDGVLYTEEIQYDAFGRPWKHADATGRWLKTEYTDWGFAAATCHSSAEDIDPGCPNSALTYLRLLQTDARGNAIKERRGNVAAMDLTCNYDPYTGRLWSLRNTDGDLINEHYRWDVAGNLLSRDKAGQYEEEFSYDPVNRLIRGKYRRIGSITYADADQPTSHWTAYDRLGNVCLKRIGNQNQAYTYHGRAGCGQAGTDTEYGQVDANLAGSPHQVVEANGFSYRYNDRGHQVAADASGTAADRTLRYTLSDQAYELLQGDPAAPSQRTRFWYGPDGARYKREELNGKRTLYIGNVEIITTGGGTTTTKRYVAGVMVQEIVGSSASNKYLFHDHLGSVARIANAAGQLLSGMDFAPFGERRGWRDPRNPATIPAATTKGFTGHEHVDAFDIVHMNGRIYDPVLGRFLQADPIIQAPGNPQNWNGYSYVFNNPLAFTDPTGMWGKREQQWLRTIAAIVIGAWTGGAAYGALMAGNVGTAFAIATAGGFAAGAIGSNSLKGGVYGAFGAMLTLGLAYGGVGYWGSVGAQGFYGGIVESLEGGRFGHGFVSAGLTAAAMPGVGRIGHVVPRTIVAAVVGGTLSEATGGKFANGAVSAAMQVVISSAASGVASEIEQERIYGEPNPASVGDNVVYNDKLAPYVSYGENSMSMDAYYDMGPGFTPEMELAFKESMFVQLNRRFYVGGLTGNVNLNVNLIRNQGMAVFTLRVCDASNICVKPSINGGYQGGSDPKLFLRGGFRAKTAVHEFLHMVGLRHQWNATNSIMSYKMDTRQVQSSDVGRIYDAYR